MPTTGPTPAPTPAPTIYPASLGCYTDKRDGRVLSNMLTSDNMTPLVCGSYCRGYAYFGTQYGSEVSDPFSCIRVLHSLRAF